MNEQMGCEIEEVRLEDGFVIYDKCNDTAWLEVHPMSAVMELRQ